MASILLAKAGKVHTVQLKQDGMLRLRPRIEMVRQDDLDALVIGTLSALSQRIAAHVTAYTRRSSPFITPHYAAESIPSS